MKVYREKQRSLIHSYLDMKYELSQRAKGQIIVEEERKKVGQGESG